MSIPCVARPVCPLCPCLVAFSLNTSLTSRFVAASGVSVKASCQAASACPTLSSGATESDTPRGPCPSSSFTGGGCSNSIFILWTSSLCWIVLLWLGIFKPALSRRHPVQRKEDWVKADWEGSLYDVECAVRLALVEWYIPLLINFLQWKGV